jgi:hypothetical protein
MCSDPFWSSNGSTWGWRPVQEEPARWGVDQGRYSLNIPEMPPLYCVARRHSPGLRTTCSQCTTLHHALSD